MCGDYRQTRLLRNGGRKIFFGVFDMKKILVLMALVAMLSVSTVNAATVTWSSELLASDGSNIVNSGVEHVGVSYGSGPNDSRIINGVNFKANDTAWNHDNPNWSGWINDRNGSATRYGAAGTALKELTNDIVYGGILMFRIRNLTIGDTYRIQIISYDASNWWNSPEDTIERWQTITAAGGVGFDFQHGTESPYANIDDVGAVLVIGTWTADATAIEFTLTDRALNDNAIINGFVVQNISPKAVNVEPADGAIGVFVSSVLRWQAPRDPNNPNQPYPDTASFVVYCDPNESRLRAATYENHAGVPYYSDQLLTGTIGDDLIQSYDPDPDMDINLTYYWRVDTRLAGAAEPNDVVAGNVWVFNTDAKPRIDTQPADLLLYDNENAVFEVAAHDPTGGSLSYQWYHNGIEPENAMEGEIHPTLSFNSPLQSMDQGSYVCKVTNSGGDTWTQSVSLIIKARVNHWAMDGDAVDSAGTYDGTLVNDPNWVEGIVGSGSIELYGNEGVAVILDEYYPASGRQFTVSAWVWAESRSNWASILKNWSDSTGGMIHMGLDGSGNNLEVQVTQANAITVGINEGSLFPLGEWQHVAAVADGSQVRLYRNGVEVGTADYDGTLRVEIPVISIGYKTGDDGLPSQNAPGYWKGKIDEVQVYNYGLSAEAIAQLYYDVSGLAPCLYPSVNDLNGDCQINILDLALIANDWLYCGRYPEAGCL